MIAALLIAGAPDRAPTFRWHVDPAAGSDTTGTGSKASPYATVGKAISVASAGDGIGVKAGATTREAALAPTTRLRIGAYGVGAKPIISGGSLVTTWSATSGGTYSATLASTTAFVTSTTGGVVTGLAKGSGSGTLTSNQFFWAAGVLFVNLGGTNPNTVTIEAAQRQSVSVTVRADGVVFRGVEFRHGQDRMVRLANSTNLIVDNCAFKYCGYVANSGSLSMDGGGAGTVRVTRCSFDYLMNDGFWWATTTGGVEFDNFTMTNIAYLAGDVQSDGFQIYTGFGVTGKFWVHDGSIDMTGLTGPKGCWNGPEGSAGASVNGSVIERLTLIGGAYGFALNGSDLTVQDITASNQITGGGHFQIDATGGTLSNFTLRRATGTNGAASGLFLPSGSPALVGCTFQNISIVDCHGNAVNFNPASIDPTTVVTGIAVTKPTVTPIAYVKSAPTSGGLPAGWDFNAYPADATNAYQFEGTNYSSITAWRTATGVDAHSVAI